MRTSNELFMRSTSGNSMPVLPDSVISLVDATGLSRSEFARRLGIGIPQMSRILNKRVPVSQARINAIESLARQLTGSFTPRKLKSPPRPRTVNRRRTVALTNGEWRFVLANPYDGKHFGNAGVYATPQSVASLVRESGQNSLD